MTAPGPFRLPRGGTLIDRSQRLPFTFNGRHLSGFKGDTLASALLANGIRIIGRSFKFHRPRGVFSAGIEEPHALVQLGRRAGVIPSARAPLVPLHEGLDARSQSGWPNVNFDALRVLDFVSPLFAAGFYNKMFMWPSWHTYEPLIRRLAGLGAAPLEPDPDRYDERNAHCDVLVVGAGIAGLRAALEAARAGQRVILVDQATAAGGQARWDGSHIDGEPAGTWIARSLDELNPAPDVQVLLSTLAVGRHDHNVVTLLETTTPAEATRERYWIVRTARLVLASGTVEQPLIFSNNDRPGVMLAGAARQYLACHGVAPGRRIVIATNNDSVYPLAGELCRAGVKPEAMLDSRPQVSAELVAQMRALSVPLQVGCLPANTGGFGALSSVEFGQPDANGTLKYTRRLGCDALFVSGGWNPALHLFAQAGGKLIFREASKALEPDNVVPHIEIVGRAADPASTPVGPRINSMGKTSRQWVDLLHDVTVSDLELALRENYTSIEHIKRFTTVGMAADQGKTSSTASLEIIARLRGCSASELGHTTLRPPLAPVTLGAIAGRTVGDRFAPVRHTPLHAWHLAHKATMENFGEWQRPAVYLRGSESRHEATLREARVVRRAAGLFDGSSLGKIEVHGPDALTFLDRFYINNLMTLKPGRARYGIMLRETGVIFDDGTVVMLAPDRVLITTTSGNAGQVYAWLEEWHQCEWPELRVAILPVTDQWATLSLTGPRARQILATLGTDVNLDNTAFPHLGMRAGKIRGTPVRIYRVSFTGELTYEINVPAGAAQNLWDALLVAGKPHGLQPFGLDALLLMRLEKGFLHIGTDTDGSTVPDDVGWGKVAAAKSADFIGKRSLLLPENTREDRLQLVGLMSDTPIVVGSHVRLEGSTEATDGWVTSAGQAPLTGESIALVLLRGGRRHTGAFVSVHDMGTVTRVKVVSPPFIDPAGDRMNA